MLINLNKNEIIISKIISNLSNYKNEKSIRFWEIGTDFILYIKRYEKLILKLKEELPYNINYEYSIELEWKLAYKNNKKTDYCFINAIIKDEKNIVLFSGDYCMMRHKEDWTKYEESNKKNVPLSAAVYRQFFETVLSMGFLYILDNQKSQINSKFIIINYVNKISSDEEILNQILEIGKKTWDLPIISSHSFRDILFTISFTYFLIEKNMNFERLENIMGKNKIIFRDKKMERRERNFEKISNEWSKENNNSFKLQTTIIKWKNENKFNEKFEEIINFIYLKVVNNWDVTEDTIQRMMIENNNYYNRNGQNKYREQMLNSYKRLSKFNDNLDGYKISEFERHDIFPGINYSCLVEASHIYDYQYCNDEEKYDIENGLLLDPAIHDFFDKDLITFDKNGYIYFKKNYKEEIERITKLNRGNIRNSVMTNKLKKYIELRLEKRKINLNDYIQLPNFN